MRFHYVTTVTERVLPWQTQFRAQFRSTTSRRRSSLRRSRRSAASWTMMAADTPLDVDVLHQKARDETGLDDFGSDDYRERFDLFLGALKGIDGLHGPGVLSFHMQLLQVLKNRLLMEQLLKVHPEIRDIELRAARRDRRPAAHRDHAPPQPARRRPDVPGAALLGVDRAVPDAERDRAGARPAARAHRHGRRLHEPGDAALQAHARDDDRARARGDPAPLQRPLLDADGDPRPRAGLARPLPRARPDAALRAHADPAPVPPAPAGRTALAAQVAAAPRAAAGAREGVPRPDRRHHPPRPGAGDALDAGDALLLGAHAPRDGGHRGDRRVLGRPARPDAPDR